MNSEALFLFLILLLGLVLSSFLGAYSQETFETQSTPTATPNTQSNTQSKNYDNYNHYNNSMTSLPNNGTFYSTDGGEITVSTDSNGIQSLLLTNGNRTISFTTSNSGIGNLDKSSPIFYGPEGSTATIVTNSSGQQAINVSTMNGSITTYSQLGDAPASVGISNIFNSASMRPTVGPPLGSKSLSPSLTSYIPGGIPFSQIPPGNEDLYILKSEIVPPVCPACPSSIFPRTEPPPPCPACARCPEPSFECKKVPNYNSINNDYLPAPVLNDFSTFGM